MSFQLPNDPETSESLQCLACAGLQEIGNNFNVDDSLLIIRTLLTKAKRILEIKKNQNQNINIDQIISSYKPPIFWKDKEIVKSQVSKWKLSDAENLIEKIYNLELSVKKNYQNSKYIISDFILNTAI